MEKKVRTDDLDIAFNLVYLSIFGVSMTDEVDGAKQPSSKAKNSQADKAPASQASKKKVHFNNDGDSDMEEDEQEYKGDAQGVSSHGRNIGTRRQAAMASNRDAGLKKMRVSDLMEEEGDEESAVRNLLGATPVPAGPTFDMQAKKFAFKLISEVKEELGGSSKINFDVVWQRYFKLDDGKQTNK